MPSKESSADHPRSTRESQALGSVRRIMAIMEPFRDTLGTRVVVTYRCWLVQFVEPHHNVDVLHVPPPHSSVSRCHASSRCTEGCLGVCRGIALGV